MEVSVSTTTGPNRRAVLCGLAAALAAPGALAACSSDAGEFQPGTPTQAAPQPTAGGGTPLAQVPVGGGTIVTKGEQTILLVQPTAGTVKGFDASCPHQGTTVDPPQNGVITCPNHFSQFDGATGALRKGPAATGLTEVPVRVVDGSVQV
jgi:cytochrome b6-f complex iron-sulfur subunit